MFHLSKKIEILVMASGFFARKMTMKENGQHFFYSPLISFADTVQFLSKVHFSRMTEQKIILLKL